MINEIRSNQLSIVQGSEPVASSQPENSSPEVAISPNRALTNFIAGAVRDTTIQMRKSSELAEILRTTTILF